MDVNLTHSIAKPSTHSTPSPWRALFSSTLACIGVVWGDLGTSPLYTISTVFSDSTFTRDEVLGALSIIFWSLFLVISIKYIVIVLSCAYNGEGGVFALVRGALVSQDAASSGVSKTLILTLLGIVGASFLISDGLITPALSVLSAVEGLPLTHQSQAVGISIGLLIPLYLCQKFGSSKVGKIFGPINLLYFFSIGGIGLYNLIKYEYTVLEAFNPYYAYHFCFNSSFSTGDKPFRALSALVLCLTGAEQIWADMGHFGIQAIYVSWIFVVGPCLYLSYAGQCAYLLSNPNSYDTIFWDSIPTQIYYPVWVLCTFATVVASQSAITGCYSMLGQAISLGIFPRLKIWNTDSNHRAQIYIPSVTVILGMGTCLIVIGFKTALALTGAFGVAVLATFLVTDFLTIFALQNTFFKKRSLFTVTLIMVPFLAIDLIYLSSSLYDKIASGGWLPLTLGSILTALMFSWYTGRRATRDSYKLVDHSSAISSQSLLISAMETRSIGILKGKVGIFLIPEFVEDEDLPRVFTTLLKVTGSITETSIFLNINFEQETPFLDAKNRAGVKEITKGIWQVDLTYGFAEPLSDIAAEKEVLAILPRLKAVESEEDLWYYVHSENVHPSKQRSLISRIGVHIYKAMLAFSTGAGEFFGLSEEKIVQLGGHLII
jgi:KUP system potassium uptake protein